MNAEFRTLIESLAKFFVSEPSAVSANTDKFGTLHRDDVAELLSLIVAFDATKGVAQYHVRMAILETQNGRVLLNAC